MMSGSSSESLGAKLAGCMGAGKGRELGAGFSLDIRKRGDAREVEADEKIIRVDAELRAHILHDACGEGYVIQRGAGF